MQFITITGRIGKDAETRTTGSNEVTSFNLAVDQGYGERKQTNWWRVSVWGKKGAGAAPYLLKGGVVTVVGQMELGEYDGKPQLNLNASDFTLPAKTQNDSRNDRQEPRQSNQGRGGGGGNYRDDLDDSVPFLTMDDPFSRRVL